MTAGTSSSIDTKKAERRALAFASLDELTTELDQLGQAHAAGTLTTTGNWSFGQICEHLAIFWKAPIDGFPEGKPPLPLRLLAQWFFKKGAAAGNPPPAGFKYPASVTWLDPGDVSVEQGLAHLREQIDRTRSGARFTHPSPLFGTFSHDEWLRVQLGHCVLHLGFAKPG
ncbi:MAG: DUF1569 domain-containing protein [Planctomycetota bacterium]